ncbi:hypothetical protein ACTA71_007474 [Dictyostelium dimigraforme]
MSILSALTSISNPMKSSKSSVANSGSRLSMGSNSVACGSCGGGNSSSGEFTNPDGSKTTYYTYTSPTYQYSYAYSYGSSFSSSCGSSLISISKQSKTTSNTGNVSLNNGSTVLMESISTTCSHIKTICYTSPKSSNARAYSPTGYGYSYSYSYGYSSCGYSF